MNDENTQRPGSKECGIVEFSLTELLEYKNRIIATMSGAWWMDSGTHD